LDKKISEISDKLNRLQKDLKQGISELGSEIEDLKESVQALEDKISKL